jgi:hypothetical protein
LFSNDALHPPGVVQTTLFINFTTKKIKWVVRHVVAVEEHQKVVKTTAHAAAADAIN